MNVTYREKNGKIQAIISYKVNGKWKQKSKQGFSKQSEAKKWAKEKQFELMELERDNIIDNETTLESVINKYIEVLKLRNCSKNTIISYETMLNFIKGLKNTPIKDLTSYDVELYFLRKSKETGCGYKGYLRCLKAIFNFACDDLKIIHKNTIRKLKVEDPEDTRIKYISKDLQKEILNTLPKKYHKILNFLYNTGLRIGEVQGLTIKDISPHEIDINKQWYDGAFHKLKTKNSYRQVPISLDMYKELKNSPTDIHGRIFYEVKHNAINKQLQKFNTSVHCYKSTYVTRLLTEGVSLKLTAQIAGDSVEVIYKTYQQLNQDTKNDELEQVRKMIK